MHSNAMVVSAQADATAGRGEPPPEAPSTAARRDNPRPRWHCCRVPSCPLRPAERVIRHRASSELAAAAGLNSAKLPKDLFAILVRTGQGSGYERRLPRYQVSPDTGLTQY